MQVFMLSFVFMINSNEMSSVCFFQTRRRFSSESAKHELYVCFHESSSQSLVEMAFALGFGT